MLNLGLIGDIQLLEPYAKRAQAIPDIHITGKSSVGTFSQSGNFRLSAPEFNRIELIERSDVLLINRFSLLPFQLLCDMVKKSKHFFATSYPELDAGECDQLAMLAAEAQTVIQIANPFYYLPAVQWLNKNIRHPAIIEVNHFKPEYQDIDILIKLLLMLKDTAGVNPKKAAAVSYHSTPADSGFNNIQLEFANGTRVIVNYGKMGRLNEFSIKSYANNQFAEFDLIQDQSLCNNTPIDIASFKETNETDSFIHSILQKKQSVTQIQDYSSVIQTVQKISSKLDRYSGN